MWLLDSDISLVHLGWVGCLTLPYLCSFLWMPFIEYAEQANLVSKKQLMSMNFFLFSLLLYTNISLNPHADFYWILLCGLSMAFVGATQDHIIEAYRKSLLPEAIYSWGISLSLIAFRIGLMLAGGGGLIFAGQYGWGVAYQVASLLMFMFSVAVMFSPTIKVPSPQQTLSMHLIESKALFSRVLKDYSFIASLLTYRLSIFWLEIMLPAFMVSWLGLGVVDVGIIYNIYGMLGLLVGGFVINHYIDLKRLPTTLYQCLCWQVVLCLLFYCSALIKPSYHIINWLVFFECALQGVLGTISTIWLMEKADIKMPAFSFSIWYGISGIGRFFVGPLAVWVIKATGWTGYMLFSVVISIGSAIITWRYMQHDNAYAV